MYNNAVWVRIPVKRPYSHSSWALVTPDVAFYYLMPTIITHRHYTNFLSSTFAVTFGAKYGAKTSPLIQEGEKKTCQRHIVRLSGNVSPVNLQFALTEETAVLWGISEEFLLCAEESLQVNSHVTLTASVSRWPYCWPSTQRVKIPHRGRLGCRAYMAGDNETSCYKVSFLVEPSQFPWFYVLHSVCC